MFRILISLCILHATVGNTNFQLEGRVVGGSNADIRNFPYQISMRLKGSHFCGGSIMNSTRINTAAHCVLGQSLVNMTIKAGSSLLYADDPNSQVRKVQRVHIHPKYDSSKFDYDIAMVVLEKPLEFNDYVQPIKVAKRSPKPGSVVTVSGWGLVDDSGNLPEILQAADLKVVSKEECSKLYASLLSERMVCATNPGQGAYYGDSGGPLTQNGALAGFVSWGSGNSQQLRTGVYGLAPKYQDFYDEYA